MIKLILTTTLLFFHLALLGQKAEQQKAVIRKNRVKTVKVYWKVPKTNPDFFKEPKGYSRIAQFSYDQDGRLIETVCPDCDELSTRDGYPQYTFIDRIEKYFYKSDRLVMREESGKETKLFKYYLDSTHNRRLIIGTKKEKRFSVAFETLDNLNREIKTVNINFEYSWAEGDTVRQIFFSKVLTDYTTFSKTTKEYGNSIGIDINKGTYEIFLNSMDIKEIERGFSALKLDDKLSQRGLRTISYDKNGNELKLVNGEAVSIFYRDKSGLVTKEQYWFPKYKDIRIYRYEFW